MRIQIYIQFNIKSTCLLLEGDQLPGTDDHRLFSRVRLSGVLYNGFVDPVKIRRVAGIVILLISLSLLIWGLWPYVSQVRTIIFYPVDMQLPDLDSLQFETVRFM